MVSSTTIQATLVALVSLLNVASGSVVTVAMLFDTVPDVSCKRESGKLWRLTRQALKNAGLHLMESRQHWHAYMTDEESHVEPEVIQEDVDAEMYNHAAEDTSGRRRLCNDFCKFMCRSQGRYCSCCSCCGNERRRNLRELNQVKLADGQSVEEVKRLAEQEALRMLNMWGRHNHIECLAIPYGVDVEIMEHDTGVTTMEEGGELEARAAEEPAWEADEEPVEEEAAEEEPAVEDCQGFHAQCGGRNYNGATCCVEGSSCVMQNEWYSQCKPISDDGSGCQRAYWQCGGKDSNGSAFSGVTCCIAGYECVALNQWYHQCRPKGN